MHIKRTATISAREQEALPSLRKFVHDLSIASPDELIASATDLLHWNRPRVDLYVFVGVLNRFDDLLESIVEKYQLKDKFVLLPENDAALTTAILDLSRIFIEHGSNRGIYSSVSHVTTLLRVANTSVVTAALNLLSKLLALRYADVRPSSRPTALRDLPVKLLRGFVRNQPHTIEYMSNHQVCSFVISKQSTLEDQLALIPPDASAAEDIVTALRASFDAGSFIYSQIYASSVLALMEEASSWNPLCSVVVDLISPNSTASSQTKQVAYDVLRDMCHSQTEIPLIRRALLVPFGNMNLMAHLSHILNDMHAATLDVDLTCSFFRLLSVEQIHTYNRVPLPLLLDFVKDGSIPLYMPVQTSAMMTLYTILMDGNTNLGPFIESNGLIVIINTLSKEVSPERLATLHEDPPSLVKVDYTFSYKRVQWIKSLFVIVANVLKHKSSALVVTQLLNTPILDVLVTVISRPETFGWLIVSMCIQILSILLKAEQSTISMLLESPTGTKVISTLPSSWAQNSYYFPPMFQFMAALLNTEQGSEIVKENNLLEQLFSSLSTSNLTVYGSLNSVGRGIEDINSEAPNYHEYTMKLVIEFIEQVVINIQGQDPWVGTDGTEDCEPPKSSVVLLNVLTMMDVIFSNHHVMVVFLKSRGLGPLLDLVCHPAIPFDLILSKEMYKPDHAFCHTMKILFSLESDTEYILDTLLDRINALSQRIAEESCALKSDSPQAKQVLAHLKALNMLLHALDAMVFSGTSYHTSLLVKHLAAEKYQELIPRIAKVYQFTVNQLATLVMTMPEHDLVASWPVSACFNIRYSPEDLEIIEDARPRVSSTFVYTNYVRCTLTLSQFCITGLLTSLTGDLNRDPLLQRCEIESFALSEKIAAALVASLNPPPNCEFPMYYLREAADLCTFVLTSKQRFNQPVFVYFKQMLGIQRLFESHKTILETDEPPVPFRLFLYPKIKPSRFSVFAQQPFFNLYKYLLYESEVLNRAHIATSPLPDFNMPQFFVEVRILVFSVVLGLVDYLHLLQPRSIMNYCELVKLVVKPIKGFIPPENQNIGMLPQHFDYSKVPNLETKIQQLVNKGVSAEDAKNALDSSGSGHNFAVAVAELNRGNYPGLTICPIEYPIGDEMPVFDNQRLVTLDQFETFCANTLLSKIGPALIACATGDNVFYAATALAQIPKASKLIIPQLAQTTQLVAVMIKEPRFFSTIQPHLLGIDYKNMAIKGDPYAITIIEQLLAKCKYEMLDGTELCFFSERFAESVWTERDSSEFLASLSALDLSPIQAASACRLTLLLCSKSPILAREVVHGNLIPKFVDLAMMFSANAYGKRIEACLEILLPIVLESESTLRNYIIGHLGSLAEESNFVNNIADYSLKWNGFLSRCPVLFIQTLREMATPPEPQSPTLIWNPAVKKYASILYSFLQSSRPEEIDAMKREHPMDISDPSKSTPLDLSSAQIAVVDDLLGRLVKYTTLFVELSEKNIELNSGQPKSCKEPVDKDLFKQLSDIHLHVQFLLRALTVLMRLNSNVAYILLNYPATSIEPNDLSKRNFMINHIVCNLIGLTQSSTAYKANQKENPSLTCATIDKVIEFQYAVSSKASRLIRLLIDVPADSPYTAKTAQKYTDRARIVVESLCKILVSEFLNVKCAKFLAKLEWRTRLLHKITALFVELFISADVEMSKFSKVPIIPAIVVEKRFVQILSMCMTRLDITNPRLDSLRTCVNQFYEWMNDYERLDYENTPDGSDSGDDEMRIDIGGDSEEGFSDASDIHLELEYSDVSPEEEPRNNLFRHSTLGMFDQDSDDEDETTQEPPYEQEYDHLSDDEILSDLEEEDDDEEDGDESLFDGDLGDLEDDFDIDAELDLSEDENEFSDDGIDLSDHSAGAHHHHHHHRLGSHSDPYEAITDAPNSDDDFAFSDSDHESDDAGMLLNHSGVEVHEVPLRRASEGTSQRPIFSLNNDSKYLFWLQTPVWISPQHIAAEDFSNGDQVDSDGIYLRGIDLLDYARFISSIPDLSLKLGTPVGNFTALDTMFSHPQYFHSETVLKLLKNMLWTQASANLTENILWWRSQFESSTDNAWETTSEGMSEDQVDEDNELEEEPEDEQEGSQDSEGDGLMLQEQPLVDHHDHPESRPESEDGGLVIDDNNPRDGRDQDDSAHIIDVSGRQVNLTELGIDPLFLEALPENIRQEVLEAQLQTIEGDSESEGYGSEEDGEEQIDSDNPFSLMFDLLNRPGRNNIHHQHDPLHVHTHRHRFLEPTEPPSLVRSIQAAVQPPSKSAGWSSAKTKRENGIVEWTPLMDSASLASFLRQVYVRLANGDDSETSSLVLLLINLCANNTLKNQIISALMSILADFCKGDGQRGFQKLTQKALSNEITKSRPIQYSSLAYSDPPVMVCQLANVLTLLLFALDRGAPMSGLNGNPFADSNLDDPLSLLNQVLVHFDEPVVSENSSALEWIAELSAKLGAAYAKRHKAAPSEQERPSEDHQDNPDDYESPSMPDISVGNMLEVVEPPSTGSQGGDESQDHAATSSKTEQETFSTENIGRLVSVLTSDQCSSSAFQYILQILSDISHVTGARTTILGKVLKDGRRYRSRVINELKLLHSRDDLSLDLTQLDKFTSPTAAQTKLLRVATFMDYFLDTRKIEDQFTRRTIYGELMSLFKALNMFPVWTELSKCLELIEVEDFKFSTALLPLIECITVISKRVLNAEKDNSFSGWLRINFNEFSLRHRKVLNHLVRINPKLLSGSFAILSKDSRVLDFDNKLKYFVRRALEEKQYLGNSFMRLNVRREQVFLDTYRSLFFKQASEIKKANIQITFQGEEGVDAGGVTREWYEILSKQIFNPDYALFIPISEGNNIFQPNVSSWVNPEHLSFFKFVGRIIGKAIYDGRIMSCYFSRALYKYLLKRPVDLKDMEAVDQEYYKSLVWMLNNDITDIITETFSVESEEFGEYKVVDLISSGSEIAVTEENKQEYVRLIVQYKLVTSVEQQLEHLAKGFDEMIPDKLRPVFYELFDERELELLICGLPDIDIDDWRNNTTYQNYTAQSPQIKWFWRCVSSFDNEERAKLLQYATGTSKVPVGGFAQLETTNGAPKFSITRDFGSNDRWPSAHTCTNQIDLPLYDSYDQMRTALVKAITEGSSGFGFA